MAAVGKLGQLQQQEMAGGYVGKIKKKRIWIIMDKLEVIKPLKILTQTFE